ncbi:MAG: fused MFS/spermidine synthase [candidate division WOR-3 bacterium]|nr:fused MFS/spermidine synthase [candidate division WOR-3 bacterium]
MGIKNKEIIFIIITGFSGIVAQLLLIREMFIIYYGNEFTLGIILANWLILEALGSFYLGRKIKNYNLLITFFIISLPLSLIILRNLKNILSLPFGQTIPIHLIFFSSLFVLFPVSITHGALFTSFAQYLSFYHKKGIALTYIYETFGTILGGLIFTFFLIKYFKSFSIIALIIFLNLLILIFNYKKRQIIFFLLIPYFLFLYFLEKIEKKTIENQWQNREVVYYHNSLYGNITILKDEEQYTLFHNGIPIIVTPTPFIASSQDFIHLPLLLYLSENRKEDLKILFLSGGIGGNIYELLRYKNINIDYLEIDPEIFKALKKFKTALTEKELNSQQLKIYHLDARYFLRKYNKEYDLIYLGIKELPDLQITRLFTWEFFSLLKKRLKEKGFFIFSLPGSLTYLPIELKLLTKTLINTLKKVFFNVLIIPGEENIFIATDNKNITQERLPFLIKTSLKYLENKESLIINENYLNLRLSPRYFDFFNSQLKNVKGKINSDFSPIGLYYFLSYFNSHFSSLFQKLFLFFEKINLSFIILFVIILAFFFNLFKRNKKRTIAFIIFSTGFYSLIFSLFISFSFQIVYGYLYYQIGLLTSAFMTGIVLGSFFTKNKNNSYFYLILFEIFIILFALFFIFQLKTIYNFPPFLFIFLAFLCGFLCGGEFPLAANFYKEEDKGKIAGTLYSADLLGGFLGGILGSSFLIPLFGSYQTLIILTLLKLLSLFFLFIIK